jgi:hypothetical protein
MCAKQQNVDSSRYVRMLLDRHDMVISRDLAAMHATIILCEVKLYQ